MKKDKGIALLMAIFISSMASVLGLGIFLLLYGQIGIAGSAKGSAIAFFASDSGIECALYYDLIEKTVLATSTYSSSPTTFSIDCNGSSVTGTFTKSGVNNNGGDFSFNFTVSPDSCAIVTVNKAESGATTINSFGENISNCSVASNRTVQRGLEVQY